jgi:hypothetical protein
VAATHGWDFRVKRGVPNVFATVRRGGFLFITSTSVERHTMNNAHSRSPRLSRAVLRSGGVIALVGAIFLNGCAGSGNAVPSRAVSVASPAPSSGGRATATLRITVPKATTAASQSRAPKYVSPATTQVAIDIRQGGVSIGAPYPQTVPLNLTAAGCSSTLAGTQCDLSLALAPGSYTIFLTAKDAGGTALSQAIGVPFTVTAGQANAIPLTLGGVPTAIEMVVGQHQDADGATTSGFALWGAFKADGTTLFPRTFTVLAVDADGNFIVGPGAPAITLTSSALTVGAPSTSAPNVWTLTPQAYTPGNLVVTATATAAASAGGATVTQLVPMHYAARFAPRIYAATGGSGVRVFDEDGNQLTGITGFGSPNNFDQGIAYDPTANGGAGALFVAEQFFDANAADQATYGTPNIYRIQEYDLSGTAIGSPWLDTSANHYPNMYGVDFDAHNGELYIGERDSNQTGSTAQIVAYTETGTVVATASTPGSQYPNILPELFGTTIVAPGQNPNNGSPLSYELNESLVSTGTPTFNNLGSPRSIFAAAYDSRNGLVYFSGNGGFVQVYKLAGGARQTLGGTFSGMASTFVNGSCIAVAIDPARGWVYFAGVNSANAGKIVATDEDGNDAVTPGGFNALGTRAANGMTIVP